MKDGCESRVGICVIVFLPHIADSSADERNKYLDIIKESRKVNGGKPIFYLWAQGGDHFDFEDKYSKEYKKCMDNAYIEKE